MQVPGCLSPSKRVERCVLGGLAGQLGGTWVASLRCLLLSVGKRCSWAMESGGEGPQGWVGMSCLRAGCSGPLLAGATLWNKTSFTPLLPLPLLQVSAGLCCSTRQAAQLPHGRRCPRWVGPGSGG